MHVPIAYLRMNQVTDIQGYDVSKVRLFVSGSSYLPPAVWEEFKHKFGPEILERYGSSETGLLASNHLDDRKPGSVGFILPGVTIEPQADGELAMKSGGLFVGYYKNPEATSKNYTKNGLWLTGDIGEFEDSGRVKLRGRLIEKMKKLGYTVFPRDVEWAMLHNHAIQDIFVLSIQSADQINDTIVYYVVGDISEQAIIDYAKQNLPAAWRPDRIVQLEDLPKTRSGKPERGKLLAMLAEDSN